MQLVLIIVVGAAGVLTTVFAAVRMWQASRAGKPREIVLGYLALMVLVSVVSLTILRTI